MAADLRLRESEEIQGDIVAGFKKDHVTLLFLKFEDAIRARNWLRDLAPQIATTRQVATFNGAFSDARRASGGDDPKTLKATWLAVSFTYEGMRMLSDKDPFEDAPPVGTGLEAFKEGSAKRAGALGDTGDNSPERWKFGNGKNQNVHAVLTIASDTVDALNNALTAQRNAAADAKIVIVFQQNAEHMSGPRKGKEHFGFKDGISEPGVRLFDAESSTRPGEVEGHPGTRLIPAGEFVIGEATAGDSFTGYPDWARNGSFHVVRRLAQDVPGWWAQISVRLGELKQAKAVPENATVEWLGARLVGRWRSGAPVCKHQLQDPTGDPSAPTDNDFDFKDDPEGLVTPLFSHLRKSSPRAGLVVNPGNDPLPAGDLDGRRIMRRGAPYGQPFDPTSGAPGSGADEERGLLFVSYQADIARQFEFIQADWIDEPNFPPGRTPEPGKDPVIAEAQVDYESLGADGAIKHTPLSFQQFVRTEGSVYAFMPSITTLKALSEGRLVPQAAQQAGGRLPQPGGKGYPCDTFLPVPDQQRKGGQSQYWVCHDGLYRKISVADGMTSTDALVKGDAPYGARPALQGVGRIDCVLPFPDQQNPDGKSWYWLFHTVGNKQVYRVASITAGSRHGDTKERDDRDLTAWPSLQGVERVDCFLPVPDQQRVNGKSWYWVFHTTGGHQLYRLVSVADGSAHTDTWERADWDLTAWASLQGIGKVDCFLPVPDQQRVNGQSQYWVFHGENYRRIAVSDGAGHRDFQVLRDRSCNLWSSLQ
ncbi:Dyp-type peroxidase [Streptomyces sp. CB01881]|uniref:Dyp-type peroxidase n=1 Tax=Streptomyces sp. CB01881 TaxID=2078691 RepID=UPI0019D63A0D|nr:Dyp-type peroxidase [Streptomyces sp. CB01881]